MNSNIDQMKSETDTELEMVLVPRVPTSEMIEAGWAAAHDEDAAGTWRCMIENYLASQQRKV